MSNPLSLRIALVAVLSTTAMTSEMAHSVDLTFTNTTPNPITIPLINNSSVSIDGQGNLSAQCVLSSGACQGMPAGGGPVGNAPGVSLSRNNGTGDITAGNAIGLTWTVQNAPELCLATSSPAVSGWNNNLVTAGGGSLSLTLASAGDYSFGVKCYNAAGASSTSTVAATVVASDGGGGGGGGGTTGIPACTTEGIAGHPFVQPSGFTGHRVTWEKMMFGAVFPNSPSSLAPVGSFTLSELSPSTRGPTMYGRYLTVGFIAQPSSNYQFSWVGAQAIGAPINYNPPRAADSVFVSISPCAGDMRARDVFSSDPWLQSICRVLASSASLKFGTGGGAGQCPLVAGQEYFLTIAMVNPTDGNLTTSETTCHSAQGGRCEANFQGL